MNASQNPTIADQSQPFTDLSQLIHSHDKALAGDAIAINLSFDHPVHQPQAGLNVLADLAAPIFSAVERLRTQTQAPALTALQHEFKQALQQFQDAARAYHYNKEYITVSSFVLAAYLDDALFAMHWGGAHWQAYALSSDKQPDEASEDKFFLILKRLIQDPAHYIELMELMYLTLKMGYEGQYRYQLQDRYQLEHMTHTLFLHIQNYRGVSLKSLAPLPLKTKIVSPPAKSTHTPLFLFFLTACLIMIAFVSLGYLTDAASNEAYQTFATLSHAAAKQMA